MFRMRPPVLFLGLLTAQLALGQVPKPAPVKNMSVPERRSTAVDTPATRTPGTVTIHQDARITALMTDYTKHDHVLKGYRVQVFLSADRKQAETIRAQFLQKRPDVSAYLSYQAPNFKVRVGDLLTRLEGEKLRAELKAEFPGCYIVPDEIELPRLPEP